ncbi:MAG: hypothetical protein WAN65_04795 [Candidatus Sulfotelmatobacter sp.]
MNVLTPTFVVSVPAYYILPLLFTHAFGTEASLYAYSYVYATFAVQNLVFAFAYVRPTRKLIRLPFRYSYGSFDLFSFLFLAIGGLLYAPILLQFPQYLLDPRQIYAHTRTGFGINFYLSSALAYLAVILIQFSQRSRWVKWFVILIAGAILALHGSKGQLLSLVLLLILFEVYVKKRRLKLLPSLAAGAGLALFLLLLFAATMTLGDSVSDALEAISGYSDYTRSAMLVIDSHFPIQYGRLTAEAHIIGRIPRLVMPNKPKDYGGLYLDEQFYPESMDQDAGVPDFGIGVQYADFGALAIVYLAVFAFIRGWLAQVFVSRLSFSRHPADFVLVVFFAEISLFPVGGVGWLLPESVALAAFLCYASRIGVRRVYRERFVSRNHLSLPSPDPPENAGVI